MGQSPIQASTENPRLRLKQPLVGYVVFQWSTNQGYVTRRPQQVSRWLVTFVPCFARCRPATDPCRTALDQATWTMPKPSRNPEGSPGQFQPHVSRRCFLRSQSGQSAVLTPFRAKESHAAESRDSRILNILQAISQNIPDVGCWHGAGPVLGARHLLAINRPCYWKPGFSLLDFLHKHVTLVNGTPVFILPASCRYAMQGTW